MPWHGPIRQMMARRTRCLRMRCSGTMFRRVSRISWICARRSAREAAEADGRGLLGWTRPSDSEKKKRPLFLVILAAIFFLLLAAAALMLNQRFGQAVTPPKHVAMTNKSAVAVMPHLQVAQPQIAAPPAIPVAPAPPPRAAIAASADKVLAAANGGNDVAETIMGLRNLDAGDSVAAFQWLEKAALQGQPVAQYRLGTLYERGQGVTANPAKAAQMVSGRRQPGQPQGDAQSGGGLCRAARPARRTWRRRRAGSPRPRRWGLSDSQFNLAVLYERGDGVPQSLIDAYKWYSIAAGRRRRGIQGAHRRAARASCPTTDRQRGQKSRRAQFPCRAAQPHRQCAARAGAIFGQLISSVRHDAMCG